MTEIKPFKAVFYNSQKVGDVSKVVCPPYDVISKEQQNDYYNENTHNFIRILLGKEKSTDNNRDNKYTRARKTFDQWFKSGILLEDDKPCIYYYKQEYRVLGQRHSRLGFISLMKIEDEKESKVFLHEKTHMSAKEDRLRLWRLLSANLSPIFVCFSDREKKVEKIFEKNVAPTQPFIDIKDDDGVRHFLWRLDNTKYIKEIVDALGPQHLFIADGHHRYEVATEYRKFKMSRTEKSNGREPYQYVMTYFTNMDSKGLKIFPMHRIVKRLPNTPPLLEFLEEFFRIDKIKSKDELAILLAKAGRNEHAFGLYRKEGIVLLRLRNKAVIDRHITDGSTEYRHLDATILKHLVFDRLGVSSEEIIYTKDIQEATGMVDKGKAAASFIMNPVKIQQLKDIALNGERMPPKTTYFYPKVLSGLTVYKMK